MTGRNQVRTSHNGCTSSRCTDTSSSHSIGTNPFEPMATNFNIHQATKRIEGKGGRTLERSAAYPEQ